MNADQWTLSVAIKGEGCIARTPDSFHDSEDAARTAWSKMNQADAMDAFIFPPNGGTPIVLKTPTL